MGILLLLLPGLMLFATHYAAKSGSKAERVAIGFGNALWIGVLLWFLLLFDGLKYNKLAYWGMAAGLWLLLFGWALGWWKKKALILLPCAAILGFAGLRIWSGYHEAYLKRIEVPEKLEISDWAPFEEGSLVKLLDAPASLQLNDALPHMDGATALYPVYSAFARATYPNRLAELGRQEIYQNYVSCHGTDLAYTKLISGDADIIFVASPSRKQEELAREKGVELIFTPIGKEGFVFFVNPANPVDDVTIDQLRGIYSGEITLWSELGAEGMGKIIPYQRNEGSGSQTALLRWIMQDTPPMEPETETAIGGMLDIVERVASYKNLNRALGYSFRFYVTELLKDLDVKLLKIDGIAPTAENIESGAYPLSGNFYAVTRSDASENTLLLLEWLQGPEGQALIAKTGYVPLY